MPHVPPSGKMHMFLFRPGRFLVSYPLGMSADLGRTPIATSGEIELERDLCGRLLALGAHHQIEPFLEEVLTLLVQVVGARRGAIKLWDGSPPASEPQFSLERGLASASNLDAFSSSVIAETFATGETIVTASALDDPRFQDRGSVRNNRLEAVLCVPVGRNPIHGVIYLQDRAASGPFSEDDRARAEALARHVATFVDLLLLRQRKDREQDPTAEVRRALKADMLVGRGPAMLEVLHQANLVARLKVSVFLTGPCGSGKTQLARVIHNNSPRAAGPFVEVNCGSIPGELIENELYGAVAGAHATANRKLPGKVAAAEGGTLFLDEVGELPRRAQASLLQLLQSRAYYPLGSSVCCQANIRIVAATNADLERETREGHFREDLYYRLNVFPIRLPGLEERRHDIPLLVAHFCQSACETHDLTMIEVSAGALRAAEAAEWPGNVRELAHAVERAVIRAHGEGSHSVERRHLFPNTLEPEPADTSPEMSFHAGTRRFQEGLVRTALSKTEGNVSAAARLLGITRAHLYNLMATFGVGRGC